MRDMNSKCQCLTSSYILGIDEVLQSKTIQLFFLNNDPEKNN